MSATARRPRQLKMLPEPTAESMAIDGHAKTMDKVADAVMMLALEARAKREQEQPMHDFFKDASASLQGVGKFLRKYGPWALASMPVVLSLIGGAVPNVAEVLSKIIQSMPK